MLIPKQQKKIAQTKSSRPELLCSCIKKKDCGTYFPVNFTKFLRKAFFYRIPPVSVPDKQR